MKKERIFWGLFLVVGAVFLIIGGMHLLPGNPFLQIAADNTAGRLFDQKPSGGELYRYTVFYRISLHPACRSAGHHSDHAVACAGSGPSGEHRAEPHLPSQAQIFWKNHVEEEFESVDQVDGNVIQLSTSFGSSIKYVNSEDLEHVKLECSFGAMKVYFDNAIIQSGKAQLDMHVSFGGVELYVPRGWRVSNQLRAFLRRRG